MYDDIEESVNRKIKDTWCGDQIEVISTELKNTREMLARLIDKIASKNIFSEDELWDIIQGYE